MSKQFIQTPRDAEYMTQVCDLWRRLISHVAAEFDEKPGQEVALYLADRARRHLPRDQIQESGEPAPRTGFYFGALCDGGSAEVKLRDMLSFPPDYLTEFEPVFQFAGMPSADCQRTSGRAMWICHQGLPALGAALGVRDLPPLTVPLDYVPQVAEILVDRNGESPPAGPASADVVAPHLTVAHVLRLKCPSCQATLWALRNYQDRSARCLQCRKLIRITGKPVPELHLRTQCSACRRRLRLRPEQIGTTIACIQCKHPLHVARHRLAAPAAPPPPSPPSGGELQLRRQLDQQRGENRRASQELIEQRSIAEHRQWQINEQAAQIQRLAQQAQVAEAARAEQSSDLRAQIQELESRLADEIRARQIAEEARAAAAGDASAKSGRIEQLQDKLIAEIRERQAYEQHHAGRQADDARRVAELQAALDAERAAREQAERQATGLRTELDNARQAVQRLQAESQEKEARRRQEATAWERRLLEQNNQIDDLRRQLETEQERGRQADALARRVAELEASPAGPAGKSDEAGEQLRKLSQQLSERDRRIALLEEMKARHDAEADGAARQLAERDARISGLTQQLAEVRRESQDRVAELERKVRSLEVELTANVHVQQASSERVKAADMMAQAKTERLEFLENRVRAAEADLRDYRASHEQLAADQRMIIEGLREQLRHQSASRESDVAAVRQEMARLREELQSRERHVAELREQIQQRSAEVADLKAQLTERDWNLESAQRVLADLEVGEIVPEPRVAEVQVFDAEEAPAPRTQAVAIVARPVAAVARPPAPPQVQTALGRPRPVGRSDGFVVATASGLRGTRAMERLVDQFQRHARVRVEAAAVGTAAALEMASAGHADAVIVNAPPLEQEWVKQGILLDRQLAYYDYFVLLGPKADPARVISKGKDIVEAFRRIASARATFISRNDGGGCHQKERAIWRTAKVSPNPEADTWYIPANADMYQTLAIACQQGAYVLSDARALAALGKDVPLVRMSRQEPMLMNVYSVARVNPDRFAVDSLHAAPAREWVEFCMSPAGQRIFAEA